MDDRWMDGWIDRQADDRQTTDRGLWREPAHALAVVGPTVW